MKKLIVLILIFISLNSFAQGTKFFKGSWAEVLSQAKHKNKMIFVDVSTTWCRPCKKMKKEILPQKKVGDILNANFINVSINAYNLDGLEFNLFYKVNSYPAFIFLDKKGKIIYRGYGFKTANQMVTLGKTAIKLHNKIDDFERDYNAGKRNYAFIIKYINALNNLDKPSEFLASEFLMSNKIREDLRLKFIYRTIYTTQNSLFSELINNIDKVKSIYEAEEVDRKIYSLFLSDIEKSGIKGNNIKIKKVLKLIKEIDFLSYNEFKTYSKLIKSEKSHNTKKYVKFAKKYFDLIQNDIRKIEFIKSLYLKQIKGESMMSLAFELSKKMYNNSKTSANQVLYIKLAVLTKHYKIAEVELKNAFKNIGENPNNELRILLKNYYNYIIKIKK